MAGNLEAGIQAMQPVYLTRVGENEMDKDEQNRQIAQNENVLNQNFNALAQELDAIKTFLLNA